MQPPSLATARQGSMALRLRLAAGELALPQIGDEEADKLKQLTWKPQSESGVKPMRGLDGDGKAGGSNEKEGRAFARPRTCTRLP